MNLETALDTVLAPLAPVFRQHADMLLDLRDNVVNARNPGACIALYFDLKKQGGLREGPELAALRSWLEEHLEILAKDAQGYPLETLPLALRGDSLEGYCNSIVRDFQEDRVYATPAIGITFQYKRKPGMS